jgi:hypothetical protein
MAQSAKAEEARTRRQRKARATRDGARQRAWGTHLKSGPAQGREDNGPGLKEQYCFYLNQKIKLTGFDLMKRGSSRIQKLSNKMEQVCDQ